MNRKIASRLLDLMEVKTQIEKSGYALLAKQQKAAFDEADALKRNAAEAADAQADAETASSTTLRHGAAYSARLYSDARGKRREGEDLEITKQQQRAHVHAAVQKEIAAERLLKAAQREDRKRRNDAEENARELNRASRAAAS